MKIDKFYTILCKKNVWIQPYHLNYTILFCTIAYTLNNMYGISDLKWPTKILMVSIRLYKLMKR